MKISDILVEKTPHLSFEVFPPKTDAAYEGVLKATEAIAELKPSYMSVTYGAGGGTSKNTVKIASHIKDKYNVPSLAHLTCVSSTKEEVHQVIDQLKAAGIENILALRGDIPQESEFPLPNHYQYAYELIEDIKSQGDFCIGAACYPEGHYESKSLDEDIQNLKYKIGAGVKVLITQLFFDNQCFYEFVGKARMMGIKVPVSAGIMPIVNSRQIERTVALSGASLPHDFTKMISLYENNPEKLFEAGIQYAVDQIRDLIINGVDGIHLYTMNNPKVALKVYEKIEDLL